MAIFDYIVKQLQESGDERGNGSQLIPNLNGTTDEGNKTTGLLLLNPVFFMDECLTSFHIPFAVIGIPINLLLIAVIIFLERLRSPRNFVWIGIGFSNIFILIGFVLEVVFSKMDPSLSLLCYNIVGGLPSGSLVINLHLSLLNRHLNLNYPSWHKSHVTNRLILTIQTACFVLFFLVFKGYNFVDHLSLRQMLPIPEVVGFIIGILILLLTSLFFGKIKVTSTFDQHQVYYCHRPTDQISTAKRDVDIHFVQIGNQRVSRLDVEAGQGIVLGAKFFSAFAAPVLLCFFILLICVYVSNEPLLSCSSFSRICFYIRCFFFGSHSALCNPIVFAIYSPDLISVWNQRFCR